MLLAGLMKRRERRVALRSTEMGYLFSIVDSVVRIDNVMDNGTEEVKSLLGCPCFELCEVHLCV
jgi:hypothetical protein